MEENDLNQEGTTQETNVDEIVAQEVTTEYYFNKKSKTSNSVKNATFGMTKQIVKLLISFGYRTVFLMVLNTAYLGLNGLFTNVLSFLSLAELGIGFSIVFRMYAPIANNDVELVASYMRLYKKLYTIIGLIVLAIGLAIMPLIPYLIKDISEIPADINLYLIYFLFLLQSVSSYFFVFRTSIFSADQKNYYLEIASTINLFITTAIQIAMLYLTKNYTLVLSVGIVTSVLQNIVMSILAKKQYPLIFKKAPELSKERKNELKKDVFGLLCYKIGDILVTSTDNILISSFIGISVVGLYSNYSMIITALIMLFGQVIGTQTAGVGLSRMVKSKEEYFKLYKKLTFLNMMLTACTSVALFTLVNPFIEVWLGADKLMGMDVVIVLGICYFFRQVRHVNITFTNASGLFKVDKWRPFAEATVNLVASIIGVKFLGIMGIFLGTLISNVGVVIWREVYLLHKREFESKQTYFYVTIIAFFIASVAISAGLYYLFEVMPVNVGYLILRFIVAGIVPISILLLLTFWTPECRFFIGKLKEIFKKIARKCVKKKE